ncbi:hypothetical protein [Candidatus Nitrosotenuis sp. DW1]|uniref:hypothetical protein n=1 Tax=Candidatus Nitrosotenuis sp. DW1 TaxID=2259672 RepID=UPI0015CE4D86|nr:hypothetical protein [Candidatus Nitrosotenuis sp. DW1]QLH08936.1 hypothetical protein DSQ19_05065 [Candidatus Nitrosotenuis sp. DW1]
MRLGSNTTDEFMKDLGEKSQKISEIFQKNIERITKPTSVNVMLGDTTVTEQTTFDPEGIKTFYSKIMNSLPDWKTSGISMTSDEDLRRIFVKLEKQAGNYVLLWHMSLQYHALLYYKVSIEVQKIQKELADLLDSTMDKEKELAEMTDSMIKEKLESLGFKDVDEQKLFEVLFENDQMREKIVEDVSGKTDFDFKAKAERKKELFKELDNLLVETYQTTSVLLDESKLIGGEEGCLCTFDLDYIKKKSRESIFDPRRMSVETKELVTKSLNEIINALSD